MTVDTSALQGEYLQALDELSFSRINSQLDGLARGMFNSDIYGLGNERDGVTEYDPTAHRVQDIDWSLTAKSSDGEVVAHRRLKTISPTIVVAGDFLCSRQEQNPGLYSEQALGLRAMAFVADLARRSRAPMHAVLANDYEYFNSGPIRPNAQAMIELAEVASSLAKENHKAQNESTTRSLFGRKKPPTTTALAKTGLTGLLDELGEGVGRKRSLITLVSDFRQSAPETGWAQAVDDLNDAGHTVVAVELKNPHDDDMPEDIRRFDLKSQGTARIEPAQMAEFRRIYREKAADQQAKIANALDSCFAHIILNTIEEDWSTLLVDQLNDSISEKRR